MNTTISKSNSPAAVAAARGAALAASIASALAAAGSLVWQGLLAFGERRARMHMLLLAAQYKDTRPELADVLRRASSARPR